MAKQYGTCGPRVLYPDICTSQPLASCSLNAQLLFDRILVQVDDQGRMLGSPSLVKAKCVPLLRRFGAKSVARALRELAQVDCIILYEVEGLQLLQMTNWWNYQSGLRRAYPSRWDPPPDWDDGVYGLPGEEKVEGRPPGSHFGRRQTARKMPAEIPQSAGKSSAKCVTPSDPVRSDSEPDPNTNRIVCPEAISSRSVGRARPAIGVNSQPHDKVRSSRFTAAEQKALLKSLDDLANLVGDSTAIQQAYKTARAEGYSAATLLAALEDMRARVCGGDVPQDLREELLLLVSDYDVRGGMRPESSRSSIQGADEDGNK